MTITVMVVDCESVWALIIGSIGWSITVLVGSIRWWMTLVDSTGWWMPLLKLGRIVRLS